MTRRSGLLLKLTTPLAFIALACGSERDAESTATAIQEVVSCAGVPAYAAGATYSAGNRVTNYGSLYECKPWPYSGWCSGAGYVPGSTTPGLNYWPDAWTQLGSCSAGGGGSGGVSGTGGSGGTTSGGTSGAGGSGGTSGAAGSGGTGYSSTPIPVEGDVSTFCAAHPLKVTDLQASYSDAWRGDHPGESLVPASPNEPVTLTFDAPVVLSTINAYYKPVNCPGHTESVPLDAPHGAGLWQVQRPELTGLSLPGSFNLFVLEDIVGISDSLGPIAAGRDITSGGFSINLTAQQPIGLIAGGKAALTTGAVWGDLVYGQGSAPPQTVSVTSGVKRQTASTYLQGVFEGTRELSKLLAGGPASAAPTTQYGFLTFHGDQPGTNVFAVDASALAAATTVYVQVPSGASAIINVSGTNAAFSSGFSLSSLTPRRLLWNFYQATSLHISGTSGKGSVLAPDAAVSFVSGDFDGQVVARSWSGHGELHYATLEADAVLGALVSTSVTLRPREQLVPGCHYEFALDFAASSKSCLGPQPHVPFVVGGVGPCGSGCAPGCPCDIGGICASDSDCKAGLTCAQDAGAFYGKAHGADVCRPSSCPDAGCGTLEDPCGLCDATRVECNADVDCPAGEVCGTDNGRLYGLSLGNVCWDELCGTPQQAVLCGQPDSLCGKLCACTPNCAGKECGDDPGDGCGGFCTGLCGAEEQGCSRSLDCPTGMLCVGSGGTTKCTTPSCAQAEPWMAYCQSAEGASCENCTECGPACHAMQQALVTQSETLPPLVPGAIDGTFDVSPSGQAQYRIPLIVPPGRGGLQPAVALQYADGAPDGLMGPGWKLAGFSQIDRCPRTYAQDEGRPASVKLNSSDAFCLNGERLIDIGAAEEGNGREYRTERDTFVKVVSELSPAGASVGPTSFKAWDKSGRVYSYGTTDDSSVFVREVAGAHRRKRAWALSRVEDRTSNFATFEYLTSGETLPPLYQSEPDWAPQEFEQLSETTELRPAKISYSPNRHITFEYEERNPDDAVAPMHTRETYVAGQRVRTTVRLKNILVTTGEGQGTVSARRYRLSYGKDNPLDPDSPTQGPTMMRYEVRLQEVYECGFSTDGETCKQPTRFDYAGQHAVTAHKFVPQSTSQWTLNSNSLQGGSVVLDANGDGRDDILVMSKDAKHRLFLSTGDPSEPFVNSGAVLWPSSTAREPCFGAFGVVDMDRDGREEVVDTCPRPRDLDGSTYAYWRYEYAEDGGEGGTFWNDWSVDVPTPSKDYRHSQVRFFDLNGDGFKDEIYLGSKTDHAARRIGIRKPGNGFDYFDAHELLPKYLYNTTFFDLDGDGVLNFARRDEDNALKFGYWFEPEFSNDEVTATVADVDFGDANGLLDKFRLADFNGDGLQDGWDPYDYPGSGGDFFWMNTGSGFVGTFYDTDAGNGSYISNTTIVADIDGDGTDELLKQDDQTPGETPSMLYSVKMTPEGIIRKPALQILGVTDAGAGENSWQGMIAGDFDGDGNLDLVGENSYYYPARDLYIVYTSLNEVGRLSKVEDGVGKQHFVSRDKRDDDEPVYESDASCDAGENRCVTRPGPLVSSVSLFTNQQVERREYSYRNLRENAGGRGSVGPVERSIKVYDDKNVLAESITEFYNTDWRIAGTLQQRSVITTVLDTVGQFPPSRRTHTYNQWEIETSDSGRPFPALTTQVERVELILPTQGQSVLYDMSRRTTEFAYDGYGNETSRETVWENTSGSNNIAVEKETVTTTHEHDGNQALVDGWFVGLPDLVTTTSERGGALRTRKMRLDHSTSTGLVTGVTRLGTAEEKLTTTVVRDAYGNVTHVTRTADDEEPRVSQTIFTSDGLYPKTEINELEHESSVQFDNVTGQLASFTDPNGLNTTWTYDAFGRLVLETGWSGTRHISYQDPDTSPWSGNGLISSDEQAQMRVVSVVDGGAWTEQDYDALGRVVMSRTKGYDNSWVTQTAAYDWRGNVIEQTQPHAGQSTAPGSVKLHYDSWGRLIQEEFPDETVVEHRYYPDGATVFPQDWLGRSDAVQVAVVSDRVSANANKPAKNVRSFDPRGAVVRSVDAKGTVTDFDYGPFGLLANVTHVVGASGSGNVTSTTYDAWGRVKTQDIPDAGHHEYDYSPFDEVVEHRDPRGITTTLVYDALGRLTNRRSNDADGIRENVWTYDIAVGGIGRLATMQSADGNATEFEYYPLGGASEGLLKAKTTYLNAETFRVGLGYDSHKRPTIISYPSIQGEAFDAVNEYDSYGHLTAVRGAPNGVVDIQAAPIWKFKEAFQGHTVSKAVLGNDYETSRVVDPLTNRVNALGLGLPSANEPLSTQTFHYYTNGNLKDRESTHWGKESFTYDELDRLKSATRAGHSTVSYDYDVRGNLALKEGRSYTYDAAGAFPHAVQAVDGTSYHYDAAGNQTRREGGLVEGGLQRIAYNEFNLPSSLETGAEGAAIETTFEYDANHNRVAKRTAQLGLETVFIDGLYERVKDTVTGGETHRYSVFADGARVALVHKTKSGGTFGLQRTDYLHNDILGSVTVVMDEAGNVVKHQDFDPWGANRNPSFVEDDVRYGFTGHEHDSESGLVNMGGRMFDPVLARFLSADPIVQAPFSLQNHNRYSYVMNRPFAFTDPSGFQQEHQTGPGGGIVGGGGAGGGAGSSGGSTAGGTEGVDLNGGSVELGSYRGKDENGGMVFQGDRFISAPHRGAEASGDRSATAPEPSNQSGAKAQTETAVPAASGAGRGPGEGSGGFKRSVREFIRNVVEASNTGARMPSGLGWALATPAAAQTQPTLTQLSSGQAAEALVTAGPIGDVETLADDNASGAQKCVAAVGMILPFLKGGTRALKAADLGLSGKGIAVLTGSIMDAGTTRIIMVDKIYADAAGIPPREAALAFSSILDNARAAGISTLQIQAAFANERLSTVVQALATRAGGTFSTVGGVDTITFSLGGHH